MIFWCIIMQKQKREKMDRRAYTEVNYIINEMPDEMKNKIPKEVEANIQNKMDRNYVVQIDDIEDAKLLPDTEKILAVLYADYLATEDEKKSIKNMEDKIKNKKIQEINKNVINPFENKENSIKNNNISLIKRKKDKWYEKIIKWIKKKF